MAAARMALRSGETPKSPRAAAIPANSATVVPRFAASMVNTANAVQRTPKRSRMSPARPCPVARASRAPSSCVTVSATAVRRSTHMSPKPNCAPASEYVVMPPASLSANAVTRPGPSTSR